MCRIFPAYSKELKAHRNTLQHTATHCNTLQHTATHCNRAMPKIFDRWHCKSKELKKHRNTLRHNFAHCNAPATHFNTLQQHTVTHCQNTLQQSNAQNVRQMALQEQGAEGTLQHAATQFNTLQRTCNTLQHTCNTLQYTSTHCNNTLQNTATTRCNRALLKTFDRWRCKSTELKALCNTLQHNSTHCNALATHFSTPQHTATH